MSMIDDFIAGSTIFKQTRQQQWDTWTVGQADKLSVGAKITFYICA